MKASKETIARTIVLLLALVNQILTAMGHSIIPIDDATVQETVSVIFTVIASLVAWWKNNSFTSEAIKADEYMNELRNKGDGII